MSANKQFSSSLFHFVNVFNKMRTIPRNFAPTVTLIAALSFGTYNNGLSCGVAGTSVLATAAAELLGQPQRTTPAAAAAAETAPPLSTIVTLFLLPSLLCTFGFVGNLLVLFAIGIERRLQNTTNYFLFSLAIADLLVCAVVMPFSILVELGNGMWAWTFRWGIFSCLLYTYADVFLCSCSIVHMTVISFDRFLGVSQPLKRHNKRKRIVLLKIAVVWVLSTIISSPLAFLSFVEQQNILTENHCGIRSRFFMLYGSVFSFLIPLAIMAITTSRTAHLLQRQAILLGSGNNFGEGLRRIMAPQRKMGGQAPLLFIANFSGGLANSSSGHSSNTTTTTTTSSSGRSGAMFQQSQNFVALRVEEKHCAVVLQQRPILDSPIIKISPAATGQKMTDSSIKNNTDQHPLVFKSVSNECGEFAFKRQQNVSHSQRKGSLFGASLWSQNLWRKSTESNGGETHGTKAQKRRRRKIRQGRAKRTAELASEQKATRVLIVVFSSFFICWTPFFVQNIILGLCGLDRCQFPSWASLSALWFGYCSSTVNPIIYTIFNKRFREMFIRILQCHYWTCWPFRHRTNLPSGKGNWPTWTDANFSSFAQRRRINNKDFLCAINRVPAQRRNSYAAGMPIQREMKPLSTNYSVKFRRSTLLVPQTPFGTAAEENKQQCRFTPTQCICGTNTATRASAKRMAPLLRQRRLSGTGDSLAQSQEETCKLYTISDSDERDGEDEFNATISSVENSEGDEGSPRRGLTSRTATEGVALIAKNCVPFGDIWRKMSWQRFARSLSNVNLDHQQLQLHGNKMRRDCTVYSLLTVPGGAAHSVDSADGQTLLQKQSLPAFCARDNSEQSTHNKFNGDSSNSRRECSPSKICPLNSMQKGKSVKSVVKSNGSGKCLSAAAEQFLAKQIHQITTTKAKI